MTAPLDTAPDTPTRSEVDAGATPTRAKRRRWRTLALVVGAPLLVVVLGWVGLQLFRPHLYSGTIMQAPTAAPPMDGLVWADGNPVDLGAFSGDLVLVYFGYTYCPDVCPTTLTQVARALDELGDDAERVHVMMISVDPERDEPAALGDYVRAFDPDFLGATGERRLKFHWCVDREAINVRNVRSAVDVDNFHRACPEQTKVRCLLEVIASFARRG